MHEQTIDWMTPNWDREKYQGGWYPGKKLLKAIRDYQKLEKAFFLKRVLGQKICKFRHRMWSILSGAEIHITTEIGGGLLIPHPQGIVIHPKAQIGPNCLILQQVTLSQGVRIGAHVDIGAGAKLIGPLTIGDHVKIGANAVVLKDVESNSTVVGIPGRILNRKGKNP